MASTITLQRSVTLASSFISYAPLTMSANDPALSNADWVRQIILSPPFAWRWNRGVVSFNTTAGVTDYAKTVPDLGWLEKAVLIYTKNGTATHELEISNNLMQEGASEQPTKIAAQLDDNAGNITFRLFPAPDDVYTVSVAYQKAAPQFVDLSSLWSPIPDYMSYVFNQGFTARSMQYRNDPRYISEMQQFLQNLLGASEGLSQDQKTLFLTERMNALRQTNAVQQGRG